MARAGTSTSLSPLPPACYVLRLLAVETGGPSAGIISIVRWNLRPVIFGVERL